jgi:hypothetical protein
MGLKAFKFFLPLGTFTTALVCDDVTGDVALSLAKNVNRVILYCDNYAIAFEISRQIKKQGIRNILILVGNETGFPIKDKCISVLVKHNFMLKKAFELKQESDVYRILDRDASVYYSFDTTQWKFLTKWHQISRYRNIWLRNGFKSNQIICHYASISKPYFIQSVTHKKLFFLKNLYFYFKQLLIANNWGEIISLPVNFLQKTNLPFIEQIRDEVRLKYDYDFKKLIKLWVSSTGSIVAEFEKGIIRLPINDYSHEKVKNNYFQLENLEIKKKDIPAPIPVAKGIFNEQPY